MAPNALGVTHEIQPRIWCRLPGSEPGIAFVVDHIRYVKQFSQPGLEASSRNHNIKRLLASILIHGAGRRKTIHVGAYVNMSTFEFADESYVENGYTAGGKW